MKYNYLPKIVLKKWTPTLMQDSIYMPNRIILANVKHHVTFEIATYAKNSPIQLCEQFPESIEHHVSFIYINMFSVVVCNLYHM